MTKATQPNELSEQDLVSAMLRREDAAWREFLVRYDKLVYASIVGVLRRFNTSYISPDIDEIYSVLMSSLLDRDMHKLRAFEFERGYRLSTWVGLLAGNAARDHLRSNRRRARTFYPLGESESAPHGEDLHRTLVARDECRRMNGVVSELSERDREFFDLQYVHCARPEEIAATMGISVKTVYSKKHKLRARCASALRSM